MVIKLHIPEEFQHPARRGETLDIVQPIGLHFAGQADKWVVKLEWMSQDGLTVGTGFFVNIPGASHDVILTAAHNLIDANGTRSKALAVIVPRQVQDADPDAPLRVVYTRLEPQPEADWGAILLPRGTVIEHGFGYSIRLGYEVVLRGDMHVVGYRASSVKGTPTTSTGPCICAYNDSLEYRADTEQGISGSPVWCEYQGKPTVVAIQYVVNVFVRTHVLTVCVTVMPVLEGVAEGVAARVSRCPSCGEVFNWVGVGKYGVHLRAREGPKRSDRTRAVEPDSRRPPPPMPAKGLFLKFSEDFELARVKLGSGSPLDVLPVSTLSGATDTLYALLYDSRSEDPYLTKSTWFWVSFNGIRSEVKLVEKLTDSCLFTVNNVKEKRKAMRVVTAPKHGKYYQLKVQSYRIREFDGDDAESSEVYMVEYPSKNDDQFTEFWFE
ncbi:hypothetical protein NM688_g260 [Phlebia brevispora]|uniref:Uncharacterized protein n=1 Tax=Phlebia brevispora TaxID=194682 RepID=A0ACC1TF68_9APHY|nr:hypothetical protein NM688_g260 [Phlebia brevispora]